MVCDGAFEAFVALGLSRLQARVYLVLLEVGETDVQSISDYAKLPRVDVDKALCALKEFGLVKVVSLSVYRAESPQTR